MLDSLVHTSCFSVFRLLSKNATDWMAYKQKKFTSTSSGGWKSKVKMPVRSGEDFLLSSILLTVIFTWRGLWYLFYKITNPNHGGSILMT